jgi:hypothetical protein
MSLSETFIVYIGFYVVLFSDGSAWYYRDEIEYNVRLEVNE